MSEGTLGCRADQERRRLCLLLSTVLAEWAANESSGPVTGHRVQG
jgi:hypothetical protein